MKRISPRKDQTQHLKTIFIKEIGCNHLINNTDPIQLNKLVMKKVRSRKVAKIVDDDVLPEERVSSFKKILLRIGVINPDIGRIDNKRIFKVFDAECRRLGKGIFNGLQREFGKSVQDLFGDVKFHKFLSNKHPSIFKTLMKFKKKLPSGDDSFERDVNIDRSDLSTDQINIGLTELINQKTV